VDRGPAEKKGLEILKKAVTQTSVLRYYNAAEEVIVYSVMHHSMGKKFSLSVKYKKGQNMFLSDTLSRDYLSDANASRFEHSLKEVDHAMSLAIPESQ